MAIFKHRFDDDCPDPDPSDGRCPGHETSPEQDRLIELRLFYADQLAEAVLGAAGLKPPDYSIEHYFGETSIQSPASHAVWEKIVKLARKVR